MAGVKTVTLRHCQDVEIYKVLSGPLDGKPCSLDISIGGAEGDGSVTVSAGGYAGGPKTTTVDTAKAKENVADACTDLTLHYNKSEGKPDTVQATYEISH